MKSYKIIIKTPYKEKFTAELDWDSTGCAMVNAFISLLIGCGYSYDNLKYDLQTFVEEEYPTVEDE